MTIWYTPSDAEQLEQLRAKLAEEAGRHEESQDEKDRVWKLLVQAAKN